FRPGRRCQPPARVGRRCCGGRASPSPARQTPPYASDRRIEWQAAIAGNMMEFSASQRTRGGVATRPFPGRMVLATGGQASHFAASIMTHDHLTDDQLLAYLDEMLPVEKLGAIESELRDSEELRRRLSGLMRRRDQGVHSIGEMWRRARLSCPARSQLGGYLL